MKEIWKPVKNYEGIYEVSNNWRLKSLPKSFVDRWGNIRVTKERLLSPVYRPEFGGRYVFGLTKAGITKQHYLHILIADAFEREIPFKSLAGEIWKAIPGTIYQISNKGRVRAKEKNYDHKNATFSNFLLLTPSYNGNYLFIKNNKRVGYVHRLVAKAFVPNPNHYSVVNHLDGNKLNNAAENLEWTTPKGNVLHALKTGLAPSGIKSVKSSFDLDDLNEIYQLYLQGFKCKEISETTGFDKRNICNFLTGRTYRKESSLIKHKFLKKV